MHTYSAFWLAYTAGLICLHPDFAERDAEPSTSADDLSMAEWLRLSEVQRLQVVISYSDKRRLAPQFIDAHERKRQATPFPITRNDSLH
jgi:hypothetical protein